MAKLLTRRQCEQEVAKHDTSRASILKKFHAYSKALANNIADGHYSRAMFSQVRSQLDILEVTMNDRQLRRL